MGFWPTKIPCCERRVDLLGCSETAFPRCDGETIVKAWRTPSRGEFARWFFLVAVLVFATAGTLAWLLIDLEGADGFGGAFPRVFWLSTVLLVCGSVALQRALGQVRVERQKPFRRALLVALLIGAAFVGVQIYGLWCLVRSRHSAEAAEVNAFVVVLVALHALHFTVALLFLVFVTLNALADRYDHEYWWGVTVCTGFWHVLGAVWLAILAVFMITSGSGA